MTVGISLLTFVPGELGGSETYVRELLRNARPRRSSTPTGCSCRRSLPSSRAGLPSEVAPEYRAGRTIPRRLLAMTRGGRPARPPARAVSQDADVVHYPLTLRLPPVSPPDASPRCSTCSTSTCRRCSRARERAFRAVAWPRSVRGSRPGDRDQRVRARPGGREARARPRALIRVIHLGRRPRAAPARERDRARRSCSTPPGAGRTRTTTGSSRRSRSCGGSAPTCGSC